jgi:hypothetical protein
MTADEFNSLPFEARYYITKLKGCLSCGNSQDLASLYKKYLNMKKTSLYTLRVGAVSYKTEGGENGVLYPINPKDSDEQIKEKLEKALIVYSVASNKFSHFNEPDIIEIVGAQPVEDEPIEDEPIEDEPIEDKPAKPLFGAAKKAAEAKAAKEANDLD